MCVPIEKQHDGESGEEFGELLKFTVGGYVGGLLLGAALDGRGLQRSGIGQWLVRTLSGEGESILEGVYAFRSRLRSGPGRVAGNPAVRRQHRRPTPNSAANGAQSGSADQRLEPFRPRHTALHQR